MKRIVINQMQFLNFKGLRELNITFNEEITSVLGRNGSGKTSIFDGFTWLLFGKDSEDRKAFNIKTLDATGKAIERLPHEVSATLTVDGQTVTLTRRFCEKWVKQRGSAVEEFKGHEEERLFNEVPCSLKDWNEKIQEVFCAEQVFKMITNPLYFTAQKSDVQRAMLFRMAGDVSDEELAESNSEFKSLLAELTGKTLDEYKREIANKKRRVKAELDAIPARLDERRRDAATLSSCLSDTPVADITAYCDSLTQQLTEAQSQLASVESQMKSVYAAYKEADKRHAESMKRVSDMKRALMQREQEVERELMKSYYEKQSKNAEIQSQIRLNESQIQSLTNNAAMLQKNIASREQELSVLRQEWMSKNAETLVIDENDFICPTCKRRFDISEIESRTAEMTENFNKNKTNSLSLISQRGKQTGAQLAKDKEQLESVNARIKELQDIIAAESENIIDAVKPNNIEQAVRSDEKVAELKRQIEDAEKTLSEEQNQAYDDIELQEEKRAITEKIEDLRSRLLTRDNIMRNNKRIEELEILMRNQSEELAQLEGIEFTIAAFSKARIEAIEGRINSMFTIVRFKMFEQQINGGEVETCEATVNGVPFSDLNNAMKINAGCDIINALCKFCEIYAPVFFDNAESLNNLPTMSSQRIALIVSNDEQLLIK